MKHVSQFWSQDQIAITVGAAVMLVLVLLVLFASRKRYGQKIDPKLADDLSKGNYEAAAERELKAGRLRTAYDLFLRAQQPLRAAHIAARQGRLQDAANLFEKAGVRNRAADLYKQLGMTMKAEELLAEDAKAAREREDDRAKPGQRLGEDLDDEDMPVLADEPIAKPAPAARVLAKAAKAAAASTPKPVAAFGAALSKSIVSRGVEAEDLALRYAADAAVNEARLGPAIEELQRNLAARGGDTGAEHMLYQLGLALVGAGRWGEARDAFQRADKAAPGYRDTSARVQELVRWQGAVGRTQFSLSHAGGKATRYTVLGELGRGGMAVVYRARDEALGREVAVKLMAEGVGNDPAAVALFSREARAVAQLNHRNIATLFDVGEQQGKAFVSMELVDGTTVEKMIEKEGKIAAAKAAGIIDQVLDALAFAHGRKTIHRDIKPANIMVTRDGTVKVMDFGLAKRVEGPDKTTMIAGSPSYMAPEQFVGKNMDGRTDLFAVGVSLYQMLTGKLPFPGLSRFEPAAPMRTLDKDVPMALDGIVMRALELDKNRRFTDAAEMAIPLRAFLASTGPAQLGAKASTSPALGTPARPSGPPVQPPLVPQADKPAFDETKPVLQELSFGEAEPAAASPSFDDVKPELQELSFGEAKPSVGTLSFGSAKAATRAVSGGEARSSSAHFSLDESGPVSAPIVEALPETIPPESNLTPRTPATVTASSVGAYRMVHPSQPDVFTPPPSTRETPGPTQKSASGERPCGLPQKTPTPFPTLKLGAKPSSGERRTGGSPAPATARAPGGIPLKPKTPNPTPRTGPSGTGPGPDRSGK